MDNEFDIHKFNQDNIKRLMEMRDTPHTCDYDYIVSSDSGTNMFFEICRICLDTRGTIEI